LRSLSGCSLGVRGRRCHGPWRHGIYAFGQERELRGGRLTLRGVSRRVTAVTNAGHSGVVSVTRLHARLFGSGIAPATDALHVAGDRGGDERTESADNRGRRRYDVRPNLAAPPTCPELTLGSDQMKAKAARQETRAMRKTRAAAAIAIVAAGLTGGIAASASADPPSNYGHCVTSGQVEPSAGALGPLNSNATQAGAPNAFERSGGHSRFSGAEACPPA